MENYKAGIFTGKKPYKVTIKFQGQSIKQETRKKKFKKIIDGISTNK